MIENNFFIITAINTILIIVVLFILFRLETNKIKLYLKRIDKKISNNDDYLVDFTRTPRNMMIDKKNNYNYNDNNDNDINDTNNINVINNNDKININDIDSYIDPMNN